MRYPAIMLLLLAFQPALAEVFKWKDAAGRVHYSDKAVGAAGAERVETEDAVASPPPVAASAPPGQATAAVRQKVTIYTRPECPYCKQAKAELRRRGVPYAERDIERSGQALREYQAMGAQGVAVLFVGSRRMNGYSKGGLDELLSTGGY